jgi:hypothetical protein
MYVVPKAMVFRPIANSPVRESSLPHLEFLSKLYIHAMRISALNELHGSLKSDLGWSQQ